MAGHGKAGRDVPLVPPVDKRLRQLRGLPLEHYGCSGVQQARIGGRLWEAVETREEFFVGSGILRAGIVLSLIYIFQRA